MFHPFADRAIRYPDFPAAGRDRRLSPGVNLSLLQASPLFVLKSDAGQTELRNLATQVLAGTHTSVSSVTDWAEQLARHATALND